VKRTARPHVCGGEGRVRGRSTSSSAFTTPSPRPSPPLRGGEGGFSNEPHLSDIRRAEEAEPIGVCAVHYRGRSGFRHGAGAAERIAEGGCGSDRTWDSVFRSDGGRAGESDVLSARTRVRHDDGEGGGRGAPFP